MVKANPNYNETELVLTGNSRALALAVDEPAPMPKARRRSKDIRRAASPRRKQLVIIVVDDSASMRRNRKCIYATEAVRELIYELKMKSGEESSFDVAIFHYGDYLFFEDEWLLTPVLGIDEDTIEFSGTSGGTKIRQALGFTKELLEKYEQGYYQHHTRPEEVPPPIVILMSDGYNGDGNPVPVAEAIKALPLSIGVTPMLVTIGIESGGDEPHVELLSDIASRNSQGVPLYYHVNDLDQLRDVVATVGSSAATNPDSIYQAMPPSRSPGNGEGGDN